jgi:ATP-dependent Lon protease
MLNNTEIFIAPQRNAFIDTPQKKDVLRVGVVARIKQVVKVQNSNNMKISVEALYRAKIISFVDSKGFFMVTAKECPYTLPTNEMEAEAYFRTAKNSFYEYKRRKLGEEFTYKTIFRRILRK